MLPHLGAPLPHDIQDRGRHIVATGQGRSRDQPRDLACRTVLAVLLEYHSPALNRMARPRGR
jgi:hypothetical protein